MSKRIGDVFVIGREKPQQCDYCGKIAELRPYGRNGAYICYACGVKDKEETEKNMREHLSGVRFAIPESFLDDGATLGDPKEVTE